MSISANKISGIRAALVYSPKTGKLAREHNNANVLCFGAGYIDFDSAKLAVKEFLSAEFEGNKPGGERHCRRIEEITSLEKKYRNNNQEE